MAQIPRYKPNQVGVAPLPDTTNRSPIEPASRSKQQGLQMGEKFFGFMQNQIKAFDEAQASQAASESTLWMDKAITNARARTGEMAVNVEAETTGAFDAWAKEREEKLTNPYQRSLFKSDYAKKRSDMSKLLMNHEVSEGLKFQESSYGQRKESDKIEAAMSYTLGEKTTIERIQGAVDRAYGHGEMTGKGEAWFDLERRNILSDMHSAVISSMLSDGRLNDARNWKAKYGKYIIEGSSKRLDDAISQGVLQNESRRIADEIWDRSGKDIGVSLSEAEGLDSPIKDNVVSQLNRKSAIKNKVEDSTNERNFESMKRVLMTNGNLEDTIEKNPEMWNSLPERQQNALRTIQKRIENSEPGFEDDGKRSLNELRDMMVKNQTQFVREPLYIYEGVLEPRQLKHLETVQRLLKQGNPAVLNQITSDKNILGVIDGLWQSAGGAGKPKPGSKQDDFYQLFKYRAWEEVMEMKERAGGKPVSGTEIEETLRKYLLQELKNGRKQGYKGRYMRYDDIMQTEDGPEYIDALRAANPDITENDIEYLWSTEKDK